MKNSPDVRKPETQRTNIIYEYSCNTGDCELLPSKYIGVTVTTLSRRLTMHLQGGGPFQHIRDKHGSKITRKELEENTKIIYQLNDRNRLEIAEALFILENKPVINIQSTGISRTLQLFGNSVS